MKKLFQKLMFLALGASFVFLYSCGEDEEPLPAAPTLTVTAANASGASVANGGSIAATDTITFSFTASTPGGFNTLRLTGGASEEFTRTALQIDAGETAPALPTISFPTDESDEGSTISINFLLVDDESQVDTVVFDFSITEAPSPDAIVQTAIILAAPLADGSSFSFYSVGENTLYSNDQIVGTSDPLSAGIDLCYYFGNTAGASIVSPSVFPSAIFNISAWGTRNSTAMVEVTDLSAEEFNGLVSVRDVEEVLERYENADAVEGFTGLEEGTIIAFETKGGIAGIFIVRDLTTGFTGSIELEMILAESDD